MHGSKNSASDLSGIKYALAVVALVVTGGLLWAGILTLAWSVWHSAGLG